MNGRANSAKNLIEHSRVNRVLILEVVVEQGLIDACRLGDGIGARSGHAFLGKFAHRCLQDRRAALFGAAAGTKAGFGSGRHY